ncbi:MAG TPA: porin, partial [Candidatus Polarisedimenticolia bacterium]
MNSADQKKPRGRVSRRTPFAAAIVALAFAAGGARAHGAPAGAPSTESGAAAQSGTSAEDRTGGARPFEYKKGLVFKSEDGSAQIKLSGYLQGDGRFYQSDDQGLAVDTFLIRRARAIVDASFLQRFDLRIVPDFGQGKTVLFDGYLNVRFNPPAQIRFGKFKPPIGLERLQSATSTSFAERALPTNLVPNRDVGLQLHGDILDQTLVYAVGLWNGVPDGVNGGDVDTNDGKDSVARIFYKPWNRTKAAALRNLGIGLAVSRGTEIGTAAAPTLPSYLSAGQVTFFKYRSTGVL